MSPETVTHYAPAGDPDPANPGGPAWIITLLRVRGSGALTVTVTPTAQLWTLVPPDPDPDAPFTEYAAADDIPADRLRAAGITAAQVDALRRAADAAPARTDDGPLTW